MGMYLYTARKTGRTTADLNGTTEQVTAMAFATKPRLDGWDLDGKTKRMATAAETRFKGDDLTGTLIAPHGIEEGAGVWRATRHCPVWFDNADFPGEFVGSLHREGRRWVVRPAPQN